MNAIKNVLENPEVIKELKVEAKKISFLYKNGDRFTYSGLIILVFVGVFYWLSSFKNIYLLRRQKAITGL
ncbi:hypothetical protein LWM68_42480 [Niabella sp. W65]|nr:hypothetical protein [Niabella sp. W65]MCH7368813.1 hypothetical protein [Niabella sp. W65]ULT44386.1 hypothetical protein KRR40_14175 [Niabella sp. I65]